MTPHNSSVTLHASDPHGEDAKRLLQEMRVEALSRYGDVIDAAAPSPANDPLVPRSSFLISALVLVVVSVSDTLLWNCPKTRSMRG